MQERRRRFLVALIAVAIVLAGTVYESRKSQSVPQTASEAVATQGANTAAQSAIEALGRLAIKGRAPKTDYRRDKFSSGWDQLGACDVRNQILKRDMTNVIIRSDIDCTVEKGSLEDPYTGKTIQFIRGAGTSDDVQIDHVVALSNAWQTGAQQITAERRHELANDPLNLLAVDGPANQNKGDADAASWLPPNKAYRCRYVARQIAVKLKYSLWVTKAEHDAIGRVLDSCPGQLLPIVSTQETSES